MTKKVYPEWVQRHRTKGTTIRKVGNNYYLYKHSSKRVQGKKNPVPKDTYIGRITPEGIIKGGNKKVSTVNGDVVVKEYGFSVAMKSLCTQGWKNAVGKNWEAVLNKIIIDESPESYIYDSLTADKEVESHIQAGAQKASFQRRIKKEYHIEISDLYLLRSVYIVTIGGKNVISRITEEQRLLLDRLGISLEVC